jgi:hypothetical protein
MNPTTVNNQRTDDIPAEIRSFIERLLVDAGVSAADAAGHERLVRGLFDKLDGYIIDTVVDNLPPEKLDDFTSFIQKNPSREALNEYLGRTLPNAQDVFVAAFTGFREAYLSAVAATRQP